MKNNLLFLFFIFLQIGVLLFSNLDSPYYNYLNTTKASLLHVLLILCFSIGYFISFQQSTTDSIAKNGFFVIDAYFFRLHYFLIFLGFITSILTVSSVIKLPEYFDLILNYKEKSVDILQIKALTGSTGLKGYFKVFNYAPLGVFIISTTFYIFFELTQDLKYRMFRLLSVSLVICLLKVIFSLERLTILSVFVIIIYIGLFNLKKSRLFIILTLVILSFLLNFVTSAKMSGMGIFNFLIYYSKIGMTNFQLLLDNYNNWSFGFNSFLYPTHFICKTFGLPDFIPSAKVSVMNGPQYFFGYLYMDFGMFSSVILFGLGYLLNKFQQKVNANNYKYRMFFFLTLFVIASTPVVPFIRATEFWLLILMHVVSFKFVKYSNPE